MRRRALRSTLPAVTVALLVASAPAVAASTTAASDPAGSAITAAADLAQDFYAAPDPLPRRKPGTLIRAREAQVQLGFGAPQADAWTVMYHSRTEQGDDVAVTGTVLQPTSAWTGAGPRPWVSLAVGTQGLGASCAPSKQLVAGTEYEDSNIATLLRKGWGVVVTDYEGYTTGSTPTYTVGSAMAHAVLDIVRAARQVPGVELAADAPLATWGYSQGGGGSAWAAALQPSYAPELNLVAAASGGIPADPKAVGDFLNGNLGAAFLLMALVANEEAYGGDQWPFSAHLNAAGQAAVATVKQLCTTEALTTFAFRNVDGWFADGYTYEQFGAEPGVVAVNADNVLADQPAPDVPVYQYHSVADEIVPLPQAAELQRDWCADGVRTRFDVYPGEHVSGNAVGAPAAVQWIDDLFSGRPVLSACFG